MFIRRAELRVGGGGGREASLRRVMAWHIDVSGGVLIIARAATFCRNELPFHQRICHGLPYHC
jgi:hypothetical protein